MSGISIDPFEPFKVLIIGLVAFALGLVIGGVPSYFIGSSHGAAKHLQSVGALKTSVDSCTSAAQTANATAEAEAKEGKAREQRLNDAFNKALPRIATEANRARSKTLSTPLRGTTECEQTVNAVRDHFMKGAP